MSRSHFENLVEAELKKLNDAVFRIASNDSLKFAEMKGQRIGLDMALGLYRKAAQTDIESEA